MGMEIIGTMHILYEDKTIKIIRDGIPVYEEHTDDIEYLDIHKDCRGNIYINGEEV